jgi:hypothetical protein
MNIEFWLLCMSFNFHADETNLLDMKVLLKVL